MSRADDVLIKRGGTHGSFNDNAEFTIGMRNQMRQMPNWRKLTPSQRLALDEITLKLARILSGGAANLKEHWDDIEGYAKLGGRDCDVDLQQGED